MAPVVAHRFIVIEGPIGVGKTSLARRLSQSLGGQLILEQATKIHFSSASTRIRAPRPSRRNCFFSSSGRVSWRMFDRKIYSGNVRVADYLLEKDRLFARVTLDDAEYGLYEKSV